MVKKFLLIKTVKTIRLLGGFMLLFVSLLGMSQQVSFTPATLPGFDANISIVGMCQDNNGFIWIATNGNGLYSYDGIRVKAYLSNENNPNSLIANKLECVFADSDGNIWIGSFEDGLDRFDPETETFTHYRHNPSDLSTIRCDSVRAIIQSHDGILWIGTTTGLDSFDPATGKFIHIDDHSAATSDLNSGQVRALYEDKAGVIWIGCGSPFPGDYANNLNITKSIPGGLFKLDRTTGKLTEYRHKDGDKTSLIDNRVRAIFEDSRGTFWVGTAGDGLHIMDRKKGTFQRLRYDPKNPQKLSRPPVNNASLFAEPVDHITFINEDSQGCIWIGTFSGGINRFNPVTNRVEFYGTSATGANKLETNDLWWSLKTRDNLLWISTTWDRPNNCPALYKISTVSGKLAYSRTGTPVTDFVQDADGNMWFASGLGLLRKNKNNSYTHFLPDKNNPGVNNAVTNLALDSLNNLWVSTRNGLYYFDTKTRAFKGYRHNINNSKSISSDTVLAILINGDGTAWVGTYRGLDLLDTRTGIFKHFKNSATSSNWIDNVIISCTKDSSGKIWVGTPNGFYSINTNTGNFMQMLKNAYLYVNSIFEDNRHRIWAGTGGYGLFVKNPGESEFTQFTDSTGLISNTLAVFGITEDNEHSLWINSSLGFLRLNPDTKNAVLFGKSWGINPQILTNNGFTSAQGEIFFGDTAGYYHFWPKDFEQPAKNTANLYLSKFYLDNNEVMPGSNNILPQPLSRTQKITLNYLQNNFTVEYNNIDFLTDPSEKNVLYKLENYDHVWRKSRGDNQALYYNVPPGKYVFRVKASNLYGTWNEKSLAMVITPPWYKTWLAYAGYFILLLIAGWNVHKFQKKRTIRKERERIKDHELAQAREIEKAYTELKATQSQLIQAEKMASLGELTAGIAHEIQNPLNFVNNFSEVNKELLTELKEEIKKGNADEVNAIADDVIANEEKINHHGKRADSIVKNMLQHSRSSSDIKEPTDINALADEYLRLSYHGLRAKDKSFTAEYKLEADEKLPKVNIVPQDIGRVLLNLVNNAFYSVSEKAKLQNGEGYKPTVTVATKLIIPAKATQKKVEITVKDNGTGIPDSVKEKIFQPFFTTKPTGQGTGLGLSLSYDIIKKGHHGDLQVETEEGAGTRFIITIPV